MTITKVSEKTYSSDANNKEKNTGTIEYKLMGIVPAQQDDNVFIISRKSLTL